MEETRKCSLISFLLLLVSISSSSVQVHAYKNYTVGDSFGWYDKTENSDLDYQKWAANKTFSLGDFLIFNTDTNHSVIQTYNSTTYNLCNYEDASDKDTTQWSEGNPSNTAAHDLSVAVPLLKEGTAYFFSSDYDGDQCRSGQRFHINVTHGQGLPKSLQNPDEDAAAGPDGAPQSSPSGDESVPDTIIPSADFSDPKQEDADEDTEASAGSLSLPIPSVHGNVIFIMLGAVHFLLCLS